MKFLGWLLTLVITIMVIGFLVNSLMFFGLS